MAATLIASFMVKNQLHVEKKTVFSKSRLRNAYCEYYCVYYL